MFIIPTCISSKDLWSIEQEISGLYSLTLNNFTVRRVQTLSYRVRLVVA